MIVLKSVGLVRRFGNILKPSAIGAEIPNCFVLSRSFVGRAFPRVLALEAVTAQIFYFRAAATYR
jgi:hypothetical protein